LRGTVNAYAFAILISAAAVSLRWLLDPLLGESFPFVTLFGSVAAAVWLGGVRAGVLATVLGYLGVNFLIISPRGGFTLAVSTDVYGLVAYLFTCSIIIAIGHAMHRARARADQRLELFRVTLRSIGDGVITTDNESRVTSLNGVAEHMTGWPLEDARGKPLDTVFRIVKEHTRAPVENPVVRALREGVIVGLANHTVLIGRDGKEIPIDDSAAPIRDERGAVSGCVLIFRDVTEQRKAEQEKARQLIVARTLAAIVETSDDAIVSKNLDGIIQSWNAGAERMLGYSAEQAIGRHISLIIPPDRLNEEEEIIRRLRAGERVDHYETERIKANGERIAVSLSISPIRSASGEVIGASKIARDMSERRRAEDELRALAADLSEADRRKNEFLATLAHELRNPLAPISNAVQLLRHQKQLTPGVVETASELLERQVAQMSRLVDDLLDMSRITRGHIELRRERIDLAVVVRQAVEATRAQYQSMNHQLTVSLPDAPVTLHADAARLAQVLGNLLNNACKFTDRGGNVNLSVVRRNGEVEIRVRDDGIGIPPSELPRVFEMFTQLNTSMERSRDGLGIGLTLVKTLVELHGGTVSVHSGGVGQGSEFIVRLPAMKGIGPEVDPPVPAGAVVSRRILIVDDNRDGAESLAMLLQVGGHETRIASDGHGALAAAEEFRPDAILLDIGLPGLNGYEVARRIRQTPWGDRAALVAITGWGQDEDRNQSRESGFDAHLVKPVDPVQLARILDGELSPKRGGGTAA
jgi:PAS domain S-box-containing protein